MTDDVIRYETEIFGVRVIIANDHLGHSVTTYCIPSLEQLRPVCAESSEFSAVIAVADHFWRITKTRKERKPRPMLFQFGIDCVRGVFEDFENGINMDFIRTKKHSLRTCMKLFPWIHKRDRPFWYVEPQDRTVSDYELRIAHVEPAECDAPNFVKNALFIFDQLGGDWNVMAEMKSN